jgi:hypothetical protein
MLCAGSPVKTRFEECTWRTISGQIWSNLVVQTDGHFDAHTLVRQKRIFSGPIFFNWPIFFNSTLHYSLWRHLGASHCSNSSTSTLSAEAIEASMSRRTASADKPAAPAMVATVPENARLLIARRAVLVTKSQMIQAIMISPWQNRLHVINILVGLV